VLWKVEELSAQNHGMKFPTNEIDDDAPNGTCCGTNEMRLPSYNIFLREADGGERSGIKEELHLIGLHERPPLILRDDPEK
jgi:hypothetical protein